jgi:hypothetical protein
VGDAAAGQLSATGVFTAADTCGSGRARAAYEGEEAQSERVDIRNVSGLVVLPSEVLSLEPGETQRFSASLKFVDGTWGDVTHEATWSWTGSPQTGSISPDGILTAGEKGGEGTVVASHDDYRDKSGHIRVRSVVRLTLSPSSGAVVHAGDSREFVLTAHYSDGQDEDVTSNADWSWTGPEGAGRMARRGLLTCAAGWSGTGCVTATCKNLTVTTGTIEVRHVTGLRIEPAAEVALSPGETKQFALLMDYELGRQTKQKPLGGLFRRSQAAGRPELVEDISAEADWSWTGDPRAGAISATGLLTAGEVADVARVSAHYQGRRVASAFVTIKAGAPRIANEPAVSEERIRARLTRVIAEVRVGQEGKGAE